MVAAAKIEPSEPGPATSSAPPPGRTLNYQLAPPHEREPHDAGRLVALLAARGFAMAERDAAAAWETCSIRQGVRWLQLPETEAGLRHVVDSILRVCDEPMQRGKRAAAVADLDAERQRRAARAQP